MPRDDMGEGRRHTGNRQGSERPRGRSTSVGWRGLGAAVLLVAPTILAAPGCTAVAAGGLGLVLGHEFQSGAQHVYYAQDPDRVWVRVKETLAHLSTRKPVIEEERRRAYATVDGGSVHVEVTELEAERSRVSVRARKYGLQNDELTMSVIDQIDRQMRR